MSDKIKNPEHYTQGGIEPIDYIRTHNMNFCLGNVIKYVTRAGKKQGESAIDDLLKAKQYIEFELEGRGKHEGD